MNGHALVVGSSLPHHRKILVYLTQGQYPPCHLLALIGNSPWVRACHQAECVTPQEGTDASAKLFHAGNKLSDLKAIVEHIFDHAESQSSRRYQVASIVIPIPNDPNQWDRRMYRYLLEGIQQSIEHHSDLHVLSITFVFPPNSMSQMDEFASVIRGH